MRSNTGCLKGSRFHAIMRELESAVLLEELAACGWNICRTARRLGLHRNTLARRCDLCDLNVRKLRSDPALRQSFMPLERKAS
jgi:transcriptional regulator of acetoin/glycerol metabolism